MELVNRHFNINLFFKKTSLSGITNVQGQNVLQQSVLRHNPRLQQNSLEMPKISCSNRPRQAMVTQMAFPIAYKHS